MIGNNFARRWLRVRNGVRQGFVLPRGGVGMREGVSWLYAVPSSLDNLRGFLFWSGEGIVQVGGLLQRRRSRRNPRRRKRKRLNRGVFLVVFAVVVRDGACRKARRAITVTWPATRFKLNALFALRLLTRLFNAPTRWRLLSRGTCTYVLCRCCSLCE